MNEKYSIQFCESSSVKEMGDCLFCLPFSKNLKWELVSLSFEVAGEQKVCGVLRVLSDGRSFRYYGFKIVDSDFNGFINFNEVVSFAFMRFYQCEASQIDEDSDDLYGERGYENVRYVGSVFPIADHHFQDFVRQLILESINPPISDQISLIDRE